jgi:hypothetical protein
MNSQINNEDNDENDDLQISIFTAKPDKHRQRQIFNFMPKEVESSKINIRFNASHNPFDLNPCFPQMDSGATPLFKLHANEESKNDGKKSSYLRIFLKVTHQCLVYWLASDAKADFDKWDRYLYEFFNNKNYQKFKDLYFESFQEFNTRTKSERVKKMVIGESHENKKVKNRLILDYIL